MNTTHPSLRRTLVIAAMLVLPGVLAAAGTGTPVVQVETPGTVEQTLTHLKHLVSRNGMMVMGALHQGRIMGMTGLHVQSETVFVGNPAVGKKLFSADPAVGLVVPIRINIYRDTSGHTEVSYVPPSKILDTYGNKKIDKVAGMLDMKLHKMVSMLAM